MGVSRTFALNLATILSTPCAFSDMANQNMLKSAVHATGLPDSVCGGDERVQVDPKNSPPYNWICSLRIEDHTGAVWGGSGFKIHIPDSSFAAVVTSGHVTYIKGAYAKRITVSFPGQADIEVGVNDLYAAPEFIATGNEDYDYGLIRLQGNSDHGFGWSTAVPDDELDKRIVTNCGYPGDKPQGTLWVTGGGISSYTDHRIYYMNDTMGGQSGSPVYTWYNGYWTVLAVHSYGGCPNSAPRFTHQMISRFLTFINHNRVVSFRSVAFPNVYIRCDGRDVTERKENGGGIVNCQYKPPGAWERFCLIPLEVLPSLASGEAVAKVALESTAFPNVFIRMDGRAVTSFKAEGSGVVNCQYGQSMWEALALKKLEDGSYAIQSVQFPRAFVRLDGSGITAPLLDGGGTVNCQYHLNGPSEGSWETFHLEDFS